MSVFLLISIKMFLFLITYYFVFLWTHLFFTMESTIKLMQKKCLCNSNCILFKCNMVCIIRSLMTPVTTQSDKSKNWAVTYVMLQAEMKRRCKESPSGQLHHSPSSLSFYQQMVCTPFYNAVCNVASKMLHNVSSYSPKHKPQIHTLPHSGCWTDPQGVTWEMKSKINKLLNKGFLSKC